MKVKSLKGASKETVGGPSLHVEHALTEALGSAANSDDEMGFLEANEAILEEDSGLDLADFAY